MSGRISDISGAAWGQLLRRIGGGALALMAGIAAVLLLWKPCLPFAAAFLLAGALQKPYRSLVGGGRNGMADVTEPGASAASDAAARREQHWRCRRCCAAAVFLVLCCVIGGGTVLWIVGALLWEELCRFFALLGENAPALIGAVGRITDGIASFFAQLPFGGEYGGELLSSAAASLSNAFPDMIGALLTSVSAKASAAVTAVISAFPRIILFFVVFLLGAIRMTQDYDAAAAQLRRFLPQKLLHIWKCIRGGVGGSVRGVLTAYAKLSALTFALLFFGLLLLGVKRAFAAALLGALIDILPVFGVGTLLLPWALFSFICGRAGFGAGLVILYLMISITRQIMEPRLIGRSMGLHPLAALFALYAGGVLFGVTGMILAPFVLTVVWGGYRMVRERNA